MKTPASIVCLMFTLVLAPGVRAEDPPQPPATEAADDTPLVNPQVVDKLIDMGNYLRSLRKFQVDAQVSRDTVLESGQKIKTESSNTLKVVGHDRLYAKKRGRCAHPGVLL